MTSIRFRNTYSISISVSVSIYLFSNQKNKYNLNQTFSDFEFSLEEIPCAETKFRLKKENYFIEFIFDHHSLTMNPEMVFAQHIAQENEEKLRFSGSPPFCYNFRPLPT